MKTNRRQFIQSAGLITGSVFLGRGFQTLASDGPTKKVGAGDLVSLGKSNLKVSRLSLGTGMKGGKRASNHTRMGQKKFTELVRGAHERGSRFFDLADMYGTHGYFADAMNGVPRDEYAFTTKIWWNKGGIPEPERPDADVVVKRFLKELKTDHLDLVLLHCVTSGSWTTDLSKQMELLARLKQEGVVRAHGVSCHSLVSLQAAAKEPWVDSIHARINPYGARMDGEPAAILDVLKEAKKNGKGVVGMKIIGEGTFRDDVDKKRASVRLALTCGCVDVLLVGCETLAELDEIRSFMAEVST